jgi:hypothetical protein
MRGGRGGRSGRFKRHHLDGVLRGTCTFSPTAVSEPLRNFVAPVAAHFLSSRLKIGGNT